MRALPVGNGRLGAMVFGNPGREQIQLNESTVWAGSPYHNNSPEALAALPEVRRMIFDDRHAEAQELIGETFFSGIHGMMYQPVGNLFLSFPGHETPQSYRRELDLGVTDAAELPTDDRVANFSRGSDPQLVELYFQFGRYLLISSSRPGTQPANLE